MEVADDGVEFVEGSAGEELLIILKGYLLEVEVAEGGEVLVVFLVECGEWL